MSAPYHDLRGRCGKIDRRHTRYRFDLEADMPWDRADQPGRYLPDSLLADLGLDTGPLADHPEAAETLQWAAALETCIAFIELEREVIDFLARHAADFAGVRSTDLLGAEEEKHIELFVRYADLLRAARPELVAPFERLLRTRRGAWLPQPDQGNDPAVLHYCFWLSTILFEDYTIYLHERLADSTDAIQPAWLAAHALHRREEEQHVATDVVMLEACALPADARRAWSRRVYLWWAGGAGDFLWLAASDDFVRQRYPDLGWRPRPRFADTGLHRELLGHRLFRRTRAAWPHLAELAAPTPAPAPARKPPPAIAPAPKAARGRTRLRGRLRALRDGARDTLRELTGKRAAQTMQRFDLRDRRRPDPEPEPEPKPAVEARPSEPDIDLDLIKKIWAEALELPVSAIDDDASFATLGGDSLRAVDIHTALEELLDRPVPAEILLECETVRQFADYLSGDVGTAAGATADATASAAPQREPIAIVGMAVRTPGASTPDELWRLVSGGADCFRDVPPGRWPAADYYDPDPAAPGKTVCVRGGFLDRIGDVDPAALQLTPEQAAAADPQQRLLLELIGELLETGAPAAGRVGVFASAGWNDYFAQLSRDPTQLGADAALGNLGNMVAARAAQLLGLTGPALTVDAACASSHLAIHLACQSLRAGECDRAVVAAAQINLGPVPFVTFSQAGVLSKRGACRPFSDVADGFVPGDGAGALLLMPLTAARAAGHRVLALIRGSATNNDGGALSGMAPSPNGQREVLGAAYVDAGLEPDVDLIEAHGTGTPIGDAVEVQAAGQLLGDPDRPVALTSIKSNLGHTLTAAGVLSVIKTVLALTHRELPPLAGLDQPNRRIDFARLGVRPVDRAAPWQPPPDRPRRAGVTGLGIGGTNVHLVLEEAPAPVAPAPVVRDADLVCVSAPTGAEVDRVAAVYADRLAGLSGGDRRAELAAINRRAHRFSWRRAVVAAPDQLPAALRAPGAAHQRTTAPRIGFVFAGPGSQYVGMAGPLYRSAPTFRRAVDDCAELLRDHLPRPLTWYLYDDPETPPAMDRIELTQPIVFAVGYALATWLRSIGVTPAAVIGHSAGEYIAACVAGALELGEAIALVSRRGAAMSRTEPGAMAAVFAGADRVRSLIALGDDLDLAAINDPDQVVISGRSDAVDRALAALEAAGVTHHRLAISCAAHSPLMAPAQRELAPLARATRSAALTVPFYSTVTGDRIPAGASIGADYWVDHLRAPVRFADAIARVADDCDLLIEIGASGGLVPCMQNSLAGRDRAPAVLPLLRRALPDSWQPVLEAVGGLVEHRAPVDLAWLDGPPAASPYPYARQPLWRSPAAAQAEPAAPTGPVIDAGSAHHIRDHVAGGKPIAPGAQLMELALAATDGTHALAGVITGRPLAVAGGPRRIAVDHLPDGRVQVASAPTAGGARVTHLTARLEPAAPAPAPVDLAAIRARCADDVAPAELYDFLATTGMTYGPTVATVRELYLGDGELLASLGADPADPPGDRRFHPGVVDGAMQAIGAFAVRTATGADRRPTFLGFSVGRLDAWRPVESRVWAHVTLSSPMTEEADAVRAEVTLIAPDGAVIARLTDVGLVKVQSARPAAPPRRAEVVLLFGGDTGLRRRLEDHGVFVLARRYPTSTSARFDHLGPIDGALLIDPTADALASTLDRLASLDLVDLAIAAPADRHDDLRARLRDLGWTGPLRLLLPDRADELPGAPAATPPTAAPSGPPAPGIAAFLRGEIATLLGRDADQIDPRTPFTRLGLDSLMAVDLVLRLERRFAVKLHPTLLFELPTVDAVAAALPSRYGVREDA